MQADLLIAVKVANDFKTEAQQEILKLSDKINELQKRRHSTISHRLTLTPVTNLENQKSWEDKAWQNLMSGFEKGIIIAFNIKNNK